MHVMVAVFALVIAVAAAARSTWSPCGQSMLSQINPIAEAGRGQRYGRTASWFIGGAVVGGLTLGGASAALAILVGRVDIGHRGAVATVALCAFTAALVDTRLLGFGPPFIRRQVNENWLSRYRPWVYGSTFGWQIGVGVVTYVMTAAVPLVIVLAALSASPWTALAVGAGFGLARGLTVLMSAPLRTQSDLYAFHRRFASSGEGVRQTVIAVQLAIAVIAAWIAAPTIVAGALSAAALALVAWAWSHRTTRPAVRRRSVLDAPPAPLRSTR